jgi:hypothetical protein
LGNREEGGETVSLTSEVTSPFEDCCDSSLELGDELGHDKTSRHVRASSRDVFEPGFNTSSGTQVSGSVSVVLCAMSRGTEFEVGSVGLVSFIDFANSHRFASTSAKVSSVGFAEVISPCVETGTEHVPRDASVPIAIGVSARARGEESADFSRGPECGGTGRNGSDVRNCGGDLGVTAG